MQNYKEKYHFWPCSKIFDHVQKILYNVKKFEHGQNIFELADGIGISLFRTWILQATQAVKIKFEIDQKGISSNSIS